MRTTKILIILLAITLASCQNQNKNLIAQAEWLLGTWEYRDDSGNVSYESWTKVNDNEFSGESYVLQGEDTIIFEIIQLTQKQDSIFYIAKVEGQNNNLPIRFALTSISENLMIFENPAHDFPQKIEYSKVDNKLMIAEISGLIKGKEVVYRFSMIRIE